MQSKLCDFVQVKLWNGRQFCQDEGEVHLALSDIKSLADRVKNSSVSYAISSSELDYPNFDYFSYIYAYRFVVRERIMAPNRYSIITYFWGKIIEKTPWTYIGTEYTKEQVTLERPDIVQGMKGMTFERAVKINSDLFIFPQEKDFIVIPKLFEH